MATVINIEAIRDEWTQFMRNSDIMTIAERGVTTDTDSGSWTSATSHDISVSNVKNIRSITVDASPLTYGTDYTYDNNFDDSGTIKTRITLNSAQTGAYVITYDYGSDKIHDDYPRDDLKLSSYPRVACDIQDMPSSPLGWGNQDVYDKVEINLMISIYAASPRKIDEIAKNVINAVKDAQTDFYYMKYVRFVNMSNLVDSGAEFQTEILHRNLSFVSDFNIMKK